MGFYTFGANVHRSTASREQEKRYNKTPATPNIFDVGSQTQYVTITGHL